MYRVWYYNVNYMRVFARTLVFVFQHWPWENTTATVTIYPSPSIATYFFISLFFLLANPYLMTSRRWKYVRYYRLEW